MAREILMESLIRRKGGSHVTVNGRTYHFTDDGTGRHVCRIIHSDDVSTLAAIREGFRMILDNGPVVQRGAIKDTKIDHEPDEQQAVGPNIALKKLDDMSDAEIRKVYQAEIGKAPHPRAKIETMIAHISAVRDESGQ